MGIKRHKPEEIVTKLRQVEVLVGQGMSRIDAIREVQNKSAAPLFDFLSAERDQLVAVQVTEVPAIKTARASWSWRTFVRATHFNRLGVNRLHCLRIARSKSQHRAVSSSRRALIERRGDGNRPRARFARPHDKPFIFCRALTPEDVEDGVVENPRVLQIVSAYSDEIYQRQLERCVALKGKLFERAVRTARR